MTTDLGFAHCSVEVPAGEPFSHFAFGFIDVPGHGKFLKNMLAGVGCLDMALLVVACDEGVMPQTRQHAEILSLLGVNQVLVVMTKSDLADETTAARSESGVRSLLDDFKMSIMDSVRVDSISGKGFDRLLLTLQKCAATLVAAKKNAINTFDAYMPVDRVFSKAGHGTVVTGTLVRGTLEQGNNVWLEPLGVKARIRGLETFGHAIEKAEGGQRLAVNLATKEGDRLERGAIISGALLSGTKQVLTTLQYANGKGKEIKVATPIRLYHGTSEHLGKIAWAQKGSADTYFCQILLNEQLFCQAGERFIARETDGSIMGGKVLAKLRPRWLTRQKAIQLLELLAEPNFAEAVHFLLEAHPDHLMAKDTITDFVPLVSRSDLASILTHDDRFMHIDGLICKSSFASELQNKIVNAVELHAAEAANNFGKIEISAEKLRTEKFPRINHDVFLSLVSLLENSKRLKRSGDLLVPWNAPAARNLEAGVKDDLNGILAENFCIEIAAIASRLNKKPEELKPVLAQLEKSGEARIVQKEFVSSAKSIAEAHLALSQLWQEKKEITPSEFKERINVTRKYAMALLSFFDDDLVTRRTTSGRILLKPFK
jgi:selenocysteine-specific elongation factor